MDWARSAKTAASCPGRPSPTAPSPAPGPRLRRLARRLQHRAVERGLQALAGLRRQVAHEAAHRRDVVTLDCSATHGALRGQGPVRVGVVALRLPRHLGQAAHQERRARSPLQRAGRSAGPVIDGARVGVACVATSPQEPTAGTGLTYTARKDESGVSPAVVRVLALERHCTVGAMARTSTRSRWRSTSSRMLGDDLVGQQVGLEAEVEELGVGGVEVVLLVLDPRIGQALGDVDPLSGTTFLTICAISRTEKDSVNWLKTRNSPRSAGFSRARVDAGQRVADVEHAPGLAAGAVDGQRVSGDRLHAEAVEHGAEDAVVVEAGGQHAGPGRSRRSTGRRRCPG